MGGILIRETLYQMQENAGQSPFPDTIGCVTHAITFNTPHTGLDPVSPHFVCGSCTQMIEMYQAGDLMLDLRKFGQNPQTSGGFTDWTVIGSECDGDVGPINAIDMHASHAIVYSQTGTNSCYDHGGTIHDQIPNQDAAQYYSDTSDPDNSPCSKNYNIGGNWKNMTNGPYGILAMYDAITDNLP